MPWTRRAPFLLSRLVSMTRCTVTFLTCGQAVQWQAKRSTREVMEQRENMITQLERAGALMQKNGSVLCAHVQKGRWALTPTHPCCQGVCDAWFADADADTTRVTGETNGHLLKTLLWSCGYKDLACAELLRNGVDSLQGARMTVWVAPLSPRCPSVGGIAVQRSWQARARRAEREKHGRAQEQVWRKQRKVVERIEGGPQCRCVVAIGARGRGDGKNDPPSAHR